MKNSILFIALSFLLFTSCPLGPATPLITEIPEEEFIRVISETNLNLSTKMQTIDITFNTNVN